MNSAIRDKSNSPQELLDVVDEKDEVIGQLSRSDIHQQKLLHREIGVLIYDDHNRLLIQQRSKHKKIMPLMWTISSAGHVLAGDSPLVTAHRELSEELGFDTELYCYTKELLDYGFEKHFAYGYIGMLPENTPIIVDRNEIEQYLLVSAHTFEEMVVQGEKFDEYSLRDIRNFFAGKILSDSKA